MKKENSNNMTARTLVSSLLFIVLLVAPTAAAAQSTSDASATQTNSTPTDSTSFSRDGVFGCNYNSAYSMSVGSFGAQGGAYVPVADATVELNTGILVYQNCVLRDIIDREREAVTSALVKQNIVALNTGRNGKPMYVQEPTKELQNAMTETYVKTLQQWQGSSEVPPYIINDIASAYKGRLDSTGYLSCPSSVGNDALLKLATPGCTDYSQFLIAQSVADTAATTRANDLAAQWQWGGGFYPQEQLDSDGNPETTVPSSLENAIANQTVTSGFRQTENANDIGQMVGGLFSGLGNQILSNQTGLEGLAEANGNQPSYLDQLVSESKQGLRQSAVNAALQNLSSALAIEQQYLQIFTDIANNLTQTIKQLRGMENQCWILIEQKECVGTTTAQSTWDANKGTGVCYDIGGKQLMVATSTKFSQAIINAQISSPDGLASTTIDSITNAQKAVTSINNIIAGVTNTNSETAQEVAIQQLDTLISQHKIHTSQDVAKASEDKSNVAGTMSQLLENIAKTWGDGNPDTSNPYDANSGWCNVNNKDTLSMWDQLWKK